MMMEIILLHCIINTVFSFVRVVLVVELLLCDLLIKSIMILSPPDREDAERKITIQRRKVRIQE